MKFRNFKIKKKEQHSESDRLNRIVYITAICLLIGIMILAAFTTAANRARKPTLDVTGTGNVPADSGIVTLPPTDTNPPESNVGVGEQVPVLYLPVDGTLGNPHDPDLQIKSNTTGDWRVHTGIDIICDEGASVYASADGTVSQVYEDPLMGYTVVIKHAGGISSVYQNLSSAHATGIAVGNTVMAGQLIGTVGDSAMLEIAEEAHLHFAVFQGDEELDPMDLFAEASADRLTRGDDTLSD